MRRILRRFAATLGSLALLAGLASGCGGDPAPREVFQFESGHDPSPREVYVSDAPLEGDAATYEVPARRVINYYQPHYEAFHQSGVSAVGGPFQTSGEVYSEEVWRSPYFYVRSEDEVLPDASPPLELDVQAGRRRLSVSGGSVWVRARITAPTFHVARRSGLSLVLLLDLTATMQEGGKLDILRRAANAVLDQVVPDDHVAVVAFAREARVVAPAAPARDVRALRAAVERTEPGGQAALASGLHLAYEEARRAEDLAESGEAHVLLLTDGLAGGVLRAEELAREHHARDIRLSVFGVGATGRPGVVATLARAGQGRAAYMDEARDVSTGVSNEISDLLKAYARDLRLRVRDGDATVLSLRGLGLPPGGVQGRETALPDLPSGESRSVLAHLRIPAGVSTLPVSFQLFFRQERPTRRTTLEDSVTFITSATPDEEPVPGVEALVQLLRAREHLLGALEGKGESRARVFLEALEEEIPRLHALARAEGDDEAARLAADLLELGRRFRTLRSRPADDPGDGWTRLLRDAQTRLR